MGDEVAVELMSEDDFNTALELAYQAGGLRVNPLAVVVATIKECLGLFRSPN